MNENVSLGPLFRVGAATVIGMLLLIPIQTVVFLVAPPPSGVADFFALFQQRPWLALLSLDLLYMVDIALAGLLLVTLCVALRRVSPSAMVIALFLNLMATAIYFASNPAFEMMTLSGLHAAATTDAQRSLYLSAGEAMLATYEGTAYNVSYVMAALAGLIVAVAMLRSSVFTRPVAYLGIIANTLGLIPPTVGTLGMVAALLFLLPFLVWLVLIARQLLQLAKPNQPIDMGRRATGRGELGGLLPQT